MVEIIISENSHLSPVYPRLSDPVLEKLVLEEHEIDRLPSDPPVRHLPLDDNLFHEGELKTHVYKVESGVICVSAIRLNRPPEFIELVFPRNLIGLGFLKRHIHNAKAVVDSCVSCWPLSVSIRWAPQGALLRRAGWLGCAVGGSLVGDDLL